MLQLCFLVIVIVIKIRTEIGISIVNEIIIWVRFGNVDVIIIGIGNGNVNENIIGIVECE